MRVHIRQNRLNRDTPAWEVWVTLDETDTRDLDQTDEAFVIASGRTREEAVDRARLVFEDTHTSCGQLLLRESFTV